MKTMRLGIAAVSLGILTAFAPYGVVIAQSAPVAAPKYQVGDTWIAETRDGFTKNLVGKIVTTVTALESDKIKLDITGQPATWDISGNVIESANQTNNPAPQFLKFPLEVGKGWTFENGWINKTQNWQGNQKINVSVLSQEKISVPAGTFEVFKIEAKGYYKNFSTNGSGAQSWMYWYSPQVKRAVRVEYKNPYEKNYTELMEYKVGAE